MFKNMYICIMKTNEENVVAFLNKSERIMKISMSRISDDISKLQAKKKLTPKKYGNAIKANKRLLSSISKQYDELRQTLNEYCSDSISKNWELSNFKNDELVEKTLTGTISAKYFNHNSKALDQFLKSSPFRSKIYDLTKDSEQLVSDYLATGITQGKSSASIARDLNKINSNPYDVTVFDIDGNQTKLKKISPFLREYKAQKGQYKKPLSNLKRLVRTETNKAYHLSNMERIKQLDFIVGYEVKLSESHSDRVPNGDMCDNLKGKYPKTFIFSSWHPQCYSDDTELMTNSGWKLFKDLKTDDKVFSLNPDTFIPEYVGIVNHFKRKYNNKMVHFNNKYFSCLVTPDHEMSYLMKNNGKFNSVNAIDYSCNKGAIYRSSEYKGEVIESIKIGKYILNFDLFAEFMGYYLSDGSIVQDRNGVCRISQQQNNDIETYCKIKKCLLKMPFKFTERFDGFHFHDKSFYEYFNLFGKSFDKYIPKEILNSSKYQIKIFLDAFISCDGHIRKPKSFIGNHGNIFNGTSDERTYFTTSPQMMSDIGECIVKIGKRPGFHNDKNKGKITKFKNGEYAANYDHWRISECKSKSATQFKKDFIDYSGFVYDIELDQNHIMYVRHNNKPFWGHNCMCRVVTIRKTNKEIREDKKTSVNTVRTIPTDAKKWIKNAKPYEKNYDWFSDNNLK